MEKKKRVLFMHQASTIGGGSYCLLNILKEIDKTYIQPVACLAGDGPLREEIEKLGIEVIIFRQMAAVPYNRTLFAISSLRSYYRLRKSINAFKSILADNKIDVVYLNNMMIYPYLKPAKEYGCKTVLHCREHWPLNEHKTQLEWARNAVNNYCDKLIAINQYSASIFPDKEATIVYDWIDMDSRYEYRPMSDILGEDASNLKVYLYTGGVQRIKGAVDVLNAFSKYIKDPNARLLVVGINPEMNVYGLRSFLSKVGIKSYYCQVREIIQKDSRIVCIPATYMIAHIMQQCYCNLSYFTIPHANLALAECEIMGIPSISADNEEAREYSLDGRLSILYKANSKLAFINAINKLSLEYDSLKTNIQSNSQEVKELFSKERNVSKLNNTINNLIS